MIKPVYFYVTIFLAAICALILVLVATGIIPTSNESPENPDNIVQDELVEPAEQGVVSVVPDRATSTQVAFRIAPPEDAQNLMKSHCAQCHSTVWLEGIKKTRTDWEKTLVKMEKFGVNLSQTEIVILIDYLAVDKLP